jgi:hypothetical protein
MELSQEEKDRIAAEETVRFETIKALKAQQGGAGCQVKGCGCGCHNQGGSCHAKGCGCGCHGQAPGWGQGGCHSHGYAMAGGCGCHRGGFCKGLILGVLLTLLFGFVCRHMFGHPYGMGYMNGSYYGSCPMQNSEPGDTSKK